MTGFGTLVSIAQFGAREGIDSTTAIQLAINSGLPLYVPPGIFTTTQPLNTTLYASLVMIGAGRNRSVIRNDLSTVFNWQGTGSHLAHMKLQGWNGHIFDQVGNTTNCHWHDLYLVQWGDAFSVYRHTNSLGNHLFNTWSHFHSEHQRSATVPTFNFVVNVMDGSTNFNIWEDGEINQTGNYGFHFESGLPGNMIYDMITRDIAWEVPSGGCVKVLGGCHTVIDNHKVYDLNEEMGSMAIKHLIHIGQGTHPVSPSPTRHTTIARFAHHGPPAELDVGIRHIFLEPSNQVHATTVEHCRPNSTGNLLVDYGNNAVTEISCPQMTRYNDAQTVELNHQGIVMRSPNGTRFRLSAPPNGGGSVSWSAA